MSKLNDQCYSAKDSDHFEDAKSEESEWFEDSEKKPGEVTNREILRNLKKLKGLKGLKKLKKLKNPNKWKDQKDL